MRPIAMWAALLMLSAVSPAVAQNTPAPGIIGPRATGANGQQNGNGPLTTGEARRESAAKVPPAIPADQARATIQDKCGGPVSGLSLDSRSTWHAKCQKNGRTETVTLGPDGNVRMP